MFDSNFARFYGRISYSLYILHPLTLIVIWHIPDAIAAALAAGVPCLVVAALLPVLSIATITPLAWAIWRFVERPGIEASRWLNARIVGTNAKPKIELIPPLSA
jgi:peptidoglycan/LPS O-acetylase OafA/YrhL